MKTQQAVLPGGTRFRASKDSPRRVPPFLWLNLVCLDAPLVAVAWLWLFARSFHIPLQIGNSVALFLTAWVIYLGDRFADASSLKPNLPRSLRQDFCLRHREIWITTLAMVAGFDAYVIWRTTAMQTLLVGAVVGITALVYLVVNHPLGLIWRSLPAKELAIGILFAAGTIVALLPSVPITPGLALAAVLFAALCSLNCISIAVWEQELDGTQGKVSIATRHPSVAHYAKSACVILALFALALLFVIRAAVPIFGCIAVSGLLLGWLNASPSFKEGRFVNRRSLVLGTGVRTALADLVLLTPVMVLVVVAL